MADVTAGQSANHSASDQLSEVFARYQSLIQAFIYVHLVRADWHLAEDLTSETFLRLVRSYTDRPIDGRVVGLLKRIARFVIADHYRVARNARETAVDFSDELGSRRLPMAYSAEDWAVENLTRDEMLAACPPLLGVAA
jgi:RNA polymerase sigma-70 factor (ECF subfamily)